MRISLLILIALFSTNLSAQSDEELIRKQAAAFSEYLVAGQRGKIVEMYTADAKIFPTDREILKEADLAEYWNPKKPSAWRTTFHKITPLEISIWGDEAYDYGYYEGTSTNGNDTSQWRGKYVIIWKKVGGEWKMYLDIWNRIKK